MLEGMAAPADLSPRPLPSCPGRAFFLSLVGGGPRRSRRASPRHLVALDDGRVPPSLAARIGHGPLAAGRCYYNNFRGPPHRHLGTKDCSRGHPTPYLKLPQQRRCRFPALWHGRLPGGAHLVEVRFFGKASRPARPSPCRRDPPPWKSRRRGGSSGCSPRPTSRAQRVPSAIASSGSPAAA